MDVPKNTATFFSWLKRESEALWKDKVLDGAIYGFQVQPSTMWNEGLTDAEIASYEHDMGFTFPRIYKYFLKVMNGTNLDAINIYGRSGEPAQHAAGYYAYPRDIDNVQEMIAWIYESCNVTPEDIEARHIPHIMPLVSHRFLVIDRCASNPVLSMHGDDIIVYASTLMAFLVNDIFNEQLQEEGLSPVIEVPFWLDL
ncbi:MAG TPA: SMI1/KNR4 family protein [Candidatus Lokiarchaeia archaeon]|nr:SMI1/KNR4 family protein [Candidatus Lokiarchaeia archaeon]